MKQDLISLGIWHENSFRLPYYFLGYVHTKPDKFENATFAAKTDNMFFVHINRFQTGTVT